MAEKDLDSYEFNSWEFFRSATVKEVRDRLLAGCDPNERDAHGVTPLYHAAAATGDPDVIVLILEAGGDARVSGNTGDTPLHWAAGDSDQPRVLEFLLRAGANPNARSDDGDTPLHQVARRRPGNPTIIEILVKAGADPNVLGEYQYTPLHWAASNCEDPAVIAALTKGNANPNLRGVGGTIALQMAVSYNSVIWGEDGKTDIVEALLLAGADPNVADDDGNTAMHFAARGTDTLKVFELLVEAGADLTVRNHKGKRPIQMMSLKRDNPRVIEYLKQVEAQQKSGPRPLLGERLAQVRKND